MQFLSRCWQVSLHFTHGLPFVHKLRHGTTLDLLPLEEDSRLPMIMLQASLLPAERHSSLPARQCFVAGAEQKMVLKLQLRPAGMAELTMRQLEADSAKEQPGAKGLLRPKAAYEAATMLVDASQHAWKVLYLDSQASAVTGRCPELQSPLCLTSVPRGICTASPLMDRPSCNNVSPSESAMQTAEFLEAQCCDSCQGIWVFGCPWKPNLSASPTPGG